jgi:hypothetical protein
MELSGNWLFERERRILHPEKILVTTPYQLENTPLLENLFYVFDKSRGYECLHPTFIVNSSLGGNHSLEEKRGYFELGFSNFARIKKEEKFRKKMEDLNNIGNFYYLIGDDYKPAVSTLTNGFVNAIELKTDLDLHSVKDLVNKGKVVNLNIEENSLADLVRNYELNACDNLTGFITLKERINEIVKKGKLPQFMIDRYKNNYLNL